MSIVFPPPPPNFYCFPSTTATALLFFSTTTNTILLFSRLHHHNSVVSPSHSTSTPGSIVSLLLPALPFHQHFNLFPPSPPPPPPHFHFFLLFYHHHHHHQGIINCLKDLALEQFSPQENRSAPLSNVTAERLKYSRFFSYLPIENPSGLALEEN